MLTSGEINIIGNILNTTWGRASTERGDWPVGTALPGTIKGHLVTSAGPIVDLPRDVPIRDGGPTGAENVRLVITYTDLVTFRSDQEVQAETKRFRSIGDKIIASRLASLRQDFRGAAGRILKCKPQQVHDSVESIYTPSPVTVVRSVSKPDVFRGYYRLVHIYTVD